MEETILLSDRLKPEIKEQLANDTIDLLDSCYNTLFDLDMYAIMEICLDLNNYDFTINEICEFFE